MLLAIVTIGLSKAASPDTDRARAERQRSAGMLVDFAGTLFLPLDGWHGSWPQPTRPESISHVAVEAKNVLGADTVTLSESASV